ncbi:hypothetical protein HKD37_04G011066 [Glycine soja]
MLINLVVYLCHRTTRCPPPCRHQLVYYIALQLSLHIEALIIIRSVELKPYGEVSRSFGVRWKDELEHTWHMLDSNGNMHSNSDFYGFIGNHQVTMTHFEQIVFFLTIFKSSFKPKAYPKWHSLYHQVPNLVTFKVLLNDSDLHTMYSLTKAARFTHLNLEGIMECGIIYNHWRKSTKIDYEWMTFE